MIGEIKFFRTDYTNKKTSLNPTRELLKLNAN